MALYFIPSYPKTYPSTGTDYKPGLTQAWAGAKARFITAYPNGLVHDPSKADVAGTIDFDEKEWSTTEGQAGMLVQSIPMNDQACFDGVLDATYTYLYNKNGKGLFSWKADKNGNLDPDDKDSASIEDLWIAYALLSADTMVKNGKWADTGRSYGSKAQALINAIWSNDIRQGRYLKPGDGSFFADKDIASPSYFATAILRTFQYYQTTWHDWSPVISQCYATLQSIHPGGNDGYFNGLCPDWSTFEGGVNPYYVGGGPSGNGYDMWYDGIRAPWVFGVDALWWNDATAVEFCRNGMNFLLNKYGSELLAAQGATMYRMDGLAYGIPDGVWHNELTVGMWAAGAMGSGLPNMQSAFDTEFKTKFMGFIASDQCWGEWAGAGQYFYNQMLANYAVLIMSGNFPNVFKDLETILPAASMNGRYDGNGIVGLTWSSVTGATGYRIFRKESAESGFVQIADVPVNLSYSDVTVTAGRSYIYAVGAYDAEGQVGELSQVSVNCPKNATDKLKIVPNPFSTQVWLHYPRSVSSTNVEVNIYNVAGELVRKLRQDDPNSTQILWDGKNLNGDQVSSGLYTAIVFVNGRKSYQGKLAKSW